MQDIHASLNDKVLFVEIASFILKIEFNFFINNEAFVDDLHQRKIFIKDIKKYLKNFIVTPKEKIDFTIVVESAHPLFIKNPHTKSLTIPLFKRISEKKIKTFFYLNIYQFQVILRDIIFNLTIKNNGCVIHGSAVHVKGKAYLFLGKSTAGKSTIVRLLKDAYTPIADDLVFIRQVQKKYLVFQTPFLEKQWWIKKENKSYEFSHAFFIRKGKETFIEKIPTIAYVINLFLDQVLIVKENKKNIIKFCSFLVKSGIQFYFLTFKKNRKDLVSLIRTNME
jgi:hypothetical protein